MEFERAKLDIDGNVGILTLNHPEVMNAVSTEMIGGIMSALHEVENPKNGVRCLVITGAGRGFCAGANLQPSGNAASRDAGSVLETHYHPMLRKLRELPMPIVSAVNGAAAGVGMSLALMGDHGAVRALVLFPPGVSAHRPGARRRFDLDSAAPRRSCARDGTFADGREAARPRKRSNGASSISVVDDAKLMDEAKALARDLANGPTVALSLIRKLYWDSSGEHLRAAAQPRAADAGQGRPARRISTRACARSWKSGRQNSKANDARRHRLRQSAE